MTTIETTDQADALPVGTVLRTARGPIAERGRDHKDGPWYIAGYSGHHHLKDTDLPATVLHDPGQAGRTVAQVKAEALRECAAEVSRIDPDWDSALYVNGYYEPTHNWLNARADELEREDKR